VLLDVVYNHFGPDGNYLHAYAPQFFNPEGKTPWGAAINFDGPDSRTVRDFYVHNALYWICEYHFDGLRFDSVHAIRDRSTPGIIEEIAQAIHAGPGRERPVHLVLENDRNEAHLLERDPSGAPRIATAQWNDDVHHALHVVATGERDGYYVDYADAPVTQLGRGARRRLRLPGRAVAVSRRRAARRAERAAAAKRIRLVPADARPGGKSRARRADPFVRPTRRASAPRSRACCSRRRCRCCSWARNTRRRRRFCSSATSGPSSQPRCAKAGARNSRASRRSPTRPVASAFPIPGAPATFEASKLRWEERAKARTASGSSSCAS
jgi:maltooligosyltrehalose trehalohydrolase